MDVRLLMMISTVAACLVGVSGRPKRNRRSMNAYGKDDYGGMTDYGKGMTDYGNGYYGATFVANMTDYGKDMTDYGKGYYGGLTNYGKGLTNYGKGMNAYGKAWMKSMASNNNTAVALTCNQCSVGLFGTCLIPDSVECDASEPNCYTGKAEFPSISGFLGFNTQGCLDSASCNSTTNGTILGATYKVTRTCCATDKCNPVVSGAGSVQLSLTAAASAALVVCLWSCLPY